MKTIKKIAVIGIALAFVVAFAPIDADAGRYHRHHHYHHPHGALLPLAVAGAVVGTAAILSAGAAGPAYPAYYAPAPVVYGPAPYPYGPVWVPGYYSGYGVWVPGHWR